MKKQPNHCLLERCSASDMQLEYEAKLTRMEREHRALCKILRQAYQENDTALVQNAKDALNYWYREHNSPDFQL
jgi:hypothetical protein